MLNQNAIKVITLDLDDTLWAIWPVIERAEKTLHAWLLERAPGAAALHLDPHVRREVRALVETQYAHVSHDLSVLRRESIRMTLHRAGEDTSLAEPAFDVFFAERMKVNLFDDVLPALALLSARYPVLALTNGNADVHAVGIGEFFTGSLTARQAGVAKPDVRIFVMAAQQLGVSLHEVLHIGDDIDMDVLGGLNAGTQTVWVNRGEHLWPHDQQPHVTVGDLGELTDLLAGPPSATQSV